MKRLGLVGVGAWGRRLIDTIGARSDCRVAAFARSSTRADVVIAGARACADWRVLLRHAAQGELDAIVAATTPLHQAELAAECAAAGVPLLVEKPLGFTAADVARVRERFEQSSRKAPLVVDYIHLWAPAYLALKERVAAAGGQRSVAEINAAGFKFGPMRGWSSLYDYAPHDLAMSLDLLGTDAPFHLTDARCTPSDAVGHELYDVRFELAGIPVHFRVGNGATTRARRFAVTFHGGRELVYDDTVPHPSKLVDGGAAVPIDEGLPLDAVLAAFMAMLEQWAAGRLRADDLAASLALSARVNAALDEITSALPAVA